jgi:acyl carrier protein
MQDTIQIEINQIAERILGRRPIHADDLLIEQLGAESADLANIIAALERRYRVEIPESSLPHLRTPRDLYEIVRSESSAAELD